MTEINWQEAFNALLTLTVAGLGYWFKTEFQRMNKRLDEMRITNEQAHKDLRTDHNECQKCLPDRYIPRAEYNTAIAGIRTDIADIKAAIIRIEGRLNRE